MHPAKGRGTGGGVPGQLLAAGFVALALTPLLAARLSALEPASPLHELGTAFGITAGALILLQFLTSGCRTVAKIVMMARHRIAPGNQNQQARHAFSTYDYW